MTIEDRQRLVETARFADSNVFSPTWMDRAQGFMLRRERLDLERRFADQMRERRCVPLGGEVTVRWRLEIVAKVAVYPQDEEFQEALPFEEFEDLMRRASPHLHRVAIDRMGSGGAG